MSQPANPSISVNEHPSQPYRRSGTPLSPLSLIMGKSQSKLTPEQLSDLQKNTYCQSCILPHTSVLSLYSHALVDKRELQQWLVSTSTVPIYPIPTVLLGTTDSSWIALRAV